MYIPQTKLGGGPASVRAKRASRRPGGRATQRADNQTRAQANMRRATQTAQAMAAAAELIPEQQTCHHLSTTGNHMMSYAARATFPWQSNENHKSQPG